LQAAQGIANMAHGTWRFFVFVFGIIFFFNGVLAVFFNSLI
jgi:hypothetical protein